MKQKRILADPYLALCGLVIGVVVFSLCILMVRAIQMDFFIFKTENGKIGGQLIFSFFAVAWLAAMLQSSRQWFLMITLTEQSIYFWSPLSKGVQAKRYRDFPNVYRCFFWNGNQHCYIVLTSQKLTDYQITHINQVSNNCDLIKLRYTRKNYEILLEMLPKKQRGEMLRCFGMPDNCKR